MVQLELRPLPIRMRNKHRLKNNASDVFFSPEIKCCLL